MEWTPELAVETDTKVRSELSTSRASLIRFIAEGAWRLLPAEYTTAAKYVQDAAGVKRSEAYRLVAMSRAAEMLLVRFVQKEDEPLTIEPYRWIVNDVIKSSHTGEYLCSIIGELTVDIEQRVSTGATVYDAISEAVFARPRPNDDGTTSAPAAASNGDGPGEGESSDGQAREDRPDRIDPDKIEKAERFMVCPNCQTPLR